MRQEIAVPALLPMIATLAVRARLARMIVLGRFVRDVMLTGRCVVATNRK
jgi:hypothetical protein